MKSKDGVVRTLHHVGYWVDDLASGARRAHETLGVGPFLVHPHVTFSSFRLADGTLIDDPAYFDHSAAFASWGPVVVELGEVHAAHPDIAAAYGIAPGAVSHVSWIVDDLAEEIERLEAAGCALIHTASAGDVSVAWHRGGPLFPHPIEVHQAGAPIEGMHERVSAAARDWDGARLLQPLAL
jgi:catechol 2,3-dioxygenase-like lactoylglutathione lyase family enzyme